MPERGNKKRMFSALLQPTGKLHLESSIGTLSVWIENQTQYDNIFCIADLHLLTISEAVRPALLREKIRLERK